MMKKIYIEPELEVVDILLLADVLGPSQDQNVEEEEFDKPGGDGFEGGDDLLP